jgi:predicted nucleotidyltransferase
MLFPLDILYELVTHQTVHDESMSQEAWFTLVQPFLSTLRTRYNLTRLYLFGPHARGEAKPGTPVDLLADLERPLSYEQFQELQAYLTECLGMPVELVLKGSLNPTIAEIILPELIPLFPAAA